MSVLGDRLKKEREKRGWTKSYVAQKLGLRGVSTYANYEYGIRDPDTDMLVQMAQLYEQTIDYLKGVNDEDNKGRKPNAPTELSPEEAAQKIIGYLDAELTNEEIVEKITLRVDGIQITDEEMDEFISFVRWQRSKKKEHPAVSKSEEP